MPIVHSTSQELCPLFTVRPKNYTHCSEYVQKIMPIYHSTSQELCPLFTVRPKNYTHCSEYVPKIMPIYHSTSQELCQLFRVCPKKYAHCSQYVPRITPIVHSTSQELCPLFAVRHVLLWWSNSQLYPYTSASIMWKIYNATKVVPFSISQWTAQGRQLYCFLISWWRHLMETFSVLLALCAGDNSPLKGQWRGALMFPLICAWINGWVNNRDAGDLSCLRAHNDVPVMLKKSTHRHFWILT